jgi:hypothetical protein
MARVDRSNFPVSGISRRSQATVAGAIDAELRLQQLALISAIGS